MNTFAFCVTIALSLIKHATTQTCDLIPKNVQTLTVKLFYIQSLDEAEFNQTLDLIADICAVTEKAGSKMTVEFHLVSNVKEENGAVSCTLSNNGCEADLVESCATSLVSQENLCKFKSCRAEIRQCMGEANIKETDVDACMAKGINSDAGRALLDSQNQANASGIQVAGPWPALVFNDEKYSQCTSDAAKQNFMEVACKLYAADAVPKPPCPA